jgi:ketosteroid isomerase-like protein
MRLFLVLLLTALACLAQDKASILALDKQWSDAIIKGDTATLDNLLADNLIYAHATGIVDTKASYIAKIKERRQVYKSFEQHKPIVNIYKDSAVTFSYVRVIGTNQAGVFDDKVMLIHFWVKQNNSWRLAAHQTTKIDKLP